MGPVTDTHRIMYRDNVMQALQERRRQFDDYFMYLDNLSGKQVSITDILGPMEAIVDAPEGGDTPDVEASHEPVWVRPRRIHWGKIVRKEDQIKALTDYKSEYVQGGVNAYVRSHNGILAASLFGPRLIGPEVPVSSNWNGRTVPVDYGNTGTPQPMSVKKILAGLRMMEMDDIVVEEEDLALALDPLENEQLWNDITYVSKDYRRESQLDDMSKRVQSILGIPVVPTKRLADYDGNTSTAALWCKSGMHWGSFMAMDIKSQQNPAKQYREHPYLEAWEGATRSEDAKVVKILNKNS